MQLVQSFHLLATLVFVLGSAVVSARLVLLARRTRQQPELFLGLAILGSAVLGYGTLIVALIVRGGMGMTDPASVPALAVGLSAIGKTLHDVGVTFFFLFIVRVFHPGERWARALAGAAMALLWGGLGWQAAHGSFRVETVGSVAWTCEYLVIWSYPVWMAVESFHYWTLMRRRRALGFADPMVVNRFALWGIGSVFSALAIWTASVPYALMDAPELSASVSPAVFVLTAIAGVASVSCSYLAFLPPAWYARRVEAQAASSAG